MVSFPPNPSNGGSGTTSISTTLADSGAVAGTYKSVTVTAKGLVTGGTNPTTLAGYGITDAASNVWTDVTGTTQTLVANTNYIADNAAQVVFTLPTTAAVGTMIRIAGAGAGGWRINQNAGQQIVFGTKTSTSGTGGYMASTYQYESITLLCLIANTLFSVINATGSPDVN